MRYASAHSTMNARAVARPPEMRLLGGVPAGRLGGAQPLFAREAPRGDDRGGCYDCGGGYRDGSGYHNPFQPRPSGGGHIDVLAGGAANGDRRVVFLSTETDGRALVRAIGAKAELIRAPSWEPAAAGVGWAEENLTLDDWIVVDTGTMMRIPIALDSRE